MKQQTSKVTRNLVFKNGLSAFVIETTGDQGKVDHITYGNKPLKVASRYLSWKWSWRWPFLKQTETVVGYWVLPKAKLKK